jgi:hypothetical protein
MEIEKRCLEDDYCKKLAEFIEKAGIEIKLADGTIVTPENTDAEDYIALAEDVLEEIKREKGYPLDWDILELVIDTTDGGILDFCWLEIE